MKEVESCFENVKTEVDNLEKAIYNYVGCSVSVIGVLTMVSRIRELLDSIEDDIRWIERNEKKKDCACPSA